MKKKPKPKTLEQFFADKVNLVRHQIRKAFTVPMQVTIIVRHPTNTEAELVFGDDDPNEVIALLERRRTGLKASQEAGSIMDPVKAATATAATNPTGE